VDLIRGDAIEALRTLPAASVDALVTDPPAGIGFMGKEWDGDKGGRQSWIAWLTDVMREALRVMKPGAHGLVWALPRTSHWTATALEDAGFEVRDVITHHFGTGFPKSLDVSKAIDKAAGAEREVVGVREGVQRPNRARLGMLNQGGGGTFAADNGATVTAPATEAAKQWAGWGTALKPASEHWILVRRPLDGTVAANVQAHGVGALNVDGCRVETNERLVQGASNLGYHGVTIPVKTEQHPAGRWPANVVLSHADECTETCALWCPVREMDAQSGVTRDGVAVQRNGGGQKIGGQGIYQGSKGLTRADAGFGGSGGASRFFYCAKPSRSERGEGNTHPTVKSIALMTYLIRLITPPGGLVLDPFAGSGTTGVAAVRGGWRFVGIEREPAYAEIAARRMAL